MVKVTGTLSRVWSKSGHDRGQYGLQLPIDRESGARPIPGLGNGRQIGSETPVLSKRTGAPATRADLHRVIKRFSLSLVDAAELDARAEDAGLLENGPGDELEEATDFDADVVRMFLDDAKRYRLLRPQEHVQLARAISIGIDATNALLGEGVDRDRRESLERLADEGRRAFRRFVASNLRLVVSIAKTYTNRGLEFADVIQEGCFGLMRAVELYEPATGTQFSTYAYYWIMQSITRAIADKSRLVRLPVHVHETLNQIRRANRNLGVRFGRDPTPSEIAEHLGIGKEKVIACCSGRNSHCRLMCQLQIR